ncbi:winged helix-turn-helix domain-containing protein [Sphingomonas sp. MMS24-J13]|uniref:winged helix-turn-helix domain-containing protein n=1 Tax=Sphingomonas sp. MMS24-J13 TaxID=3238686 RepID=UPI00384F89FA
MSADPLKVEVRANMADQPVDLALEQPFRLGPLAVVPRSRKIVAASGTQSTLEPRVMQVLIALARAEGVTVSREELIRTCWNGAVVGEDSINRTIWMLRKAAVGIAGGAFSIETIPKLGYRLVLPAPESGPSAVEDQPRARIRLVAHPRWLAALAVTVLVIAVALLALSWRPTAKGPEYSVNVQPFRISGAARGFDERLLSALTSQNVPTAAGRVRLTLTGSVEERAGAIRVDARLINSASDEVVWSGAITSPTGEPGGLTRTAEIVGMVAQCTVAGANDGGGMIPVDILSAYARTCELGYRGQSTQGLRVARELTKRAPDFAPGWFALSHHAATLYFGEPREDAALRQEALAAAEKLIALRPDAQDGYTSKYLVLDRTRIFERERVLLRATPLEPLYADVADSYLGDLLLQAGRFEEAFQLYRAMALQKPDLVSAQVGLFHAAAVTGRWPVADKALERVKQLNAPALPGLLHRKAMWTANWAAAEQLMPVESPAQRKAGIAAYRALTSGDPADKQAATRLLMALPADCCMPLRIELLTQLGRRADAAALFDAFVAARTPDTRHGSPILANPTLRPLLDDPSIERYLRDSGWIGYWVRGGTRPDFCKQAAPPTSCH